MYAFLQLNKLLIFSFQDWNKFSDTRKTTTLTYAQVARVFQSKFLLFTVNNKLSFGYEICHINFCLNCVIFQLMQVLINTFLIPAWQIKSKTTHTFAHVFLADDL